MMANEIVNIYQFANFYNQVHASQYMRWTKMFTGLIYIREVTRNKNVKYFFKHLFNVYLPSVLLFVAILKPVLWDRLALPQYCTTICCVWCNGDLFWFQIKLVCSGGYWLYMALIIMIHINIFFLTSPEKSAFKSHLSLFALLQCVDMTYKYYFMSLRFIYFHFAPQESCMSWNFKYIYK